MNDLSCEMLTAYGKHTPRANALLDQYGMRFESDALDDFQLLVQNHFYMGVHTAFQQTILNALGRKLGAQQEIAAALGLKDRSSISQMVRSQTMDGIRITAALYQVPDIKLPSRERAALFGFARATSFVKAVAHQDRSVEGTMSPQDFSYLVGILANDQWDRAIRDVDPRVARQLASEIVSQRVITQIGHVNQKHRPEQLVLTLQELWFRWADFAILTLWAIPECIPADTIRA